VKCSSDAHSSRYALATTRSKNLRTRLCFSNRSRFFVNVVASHDAASSDRSMNHLYSRFTWICSTSCRSERIEYSACSSSAFSRISGGIDGRPSFEYARSKSLRIDARTSSARRFTARSG